MGKKKQSWKKKRVISEKKKDLKKRGKVGKKN